ncbi:4Fe-4S dicluster domain-containing protein [Sporomusa sp.]|jgi:NAD-dependent dihydropyrimidine dehydrogenase PreA subunit|uniref:4Fe-4S dicluster domain-containing protein n=1 Tax=Sporomusa sp. TaxID=2078658 RepID=UPI002B9B26C6|nr:4Fe-4S binding protein [Sporomusa sp.]MDF2875344.1 4Fe-4S dicluster protein [Sporomusa sp.]HWR06486.1 4Fe-4S binding protein [Sporomusa sp.]
MSCKEGKQYQWLDFSGEKCSACGLCIDYCPRDVLRKGDEGVPFMKYRDDCWYCDICSFVCPHKAITLKEVPYLIK